MSYQIKSVPLLLLMFFSSCHFSNKVKKQDCDQIKDFKMGYISFRLPACYKIDYKDSIYKTDGWLVKDTLTDLRIGTGGASAELFDVRKDLHEDALVTYVDTISHFLKQVFSFKKGNGYCFGVSINNLIKGEDYKGSDSTLMLLSKKCWYTIFDAGNYSIPITKNEKDILVEAFKNCIIDTAAIEKDKREFQRRMDSVNMMFYSAPSKTYRQMN